MLDATMDARPPATPDTAEPGHVALFPAEAAAAAQHRINLLRHHLALSQHRAALLQARLDEVERLYGAVQSSTAWRVTGPLRRLGEQARTALGRSPSSPPTEPSLLPVPTDSATPPETIKLTVSNTPAVSVIVTSYGHADHTRRCLASIALALPQASIEVIVIDDASGDPAVAALGGVTGLQLLVSPRNLGFGGACNHAAATARGEFLLFLNNDTQVLPGWLDSLRLLFEEPGTGAAGSMLLYPDGRLQEAGGIVWNDGSGWNYGRGDNPANPVYHYVREVDYCSAASLMVRRDTFERLGGFDPRYAPAYFEDSDLAFKLRREGLRVLYQPLSRVIHLEGVTNGTDIAVGGKAHQARNHEIFVRAWADVLARDHCPSGTRLIRARDHALRRPVVLVVDHYVPEPDRDAGSRTMMAMLNALVDAGALVKFLPQGGTATARFIGDLRARGIEVVEPYGPGELHGWLAVNGGELDHVLLSRPTVAMEYIDALRAGTRAPIAFYGHDLHFARMRRQAEVLDDPAMARDADAMERVERRIWRNVATVLYPSEDEVATVHALEPCADARIVLPFCFERFAEPRTPPAALDVLFVAGFAHPPNEDAAAWFVAETLPLIRARVPGAGLRIVGSNPTERVRALAGPGVTVAADVSDAELAAAYAGARVAIVPLRFGAGVKLKVVEALREGVPLVTTPTGAQGLAGLEDVVTVTDEPQAFAAGVCRLLTDDAAWSLACRRQIEHARARFSKAAFSRSLLDGLGLPERA